MHNLVAVVLLVAATSYKPSVSLAAPVNPQLVQRRDAIAATLPVALKEKLQTIASSLTSITDGTSKAAIKANVGSLEGADIEALAFLVMMDAAQSAREDLKSIMDHVKAINSAKDALRTELENVNHVAPTTPSVRKVQANTVATSFTMPPPLPPNATVAQKQDRINVLNELSEEEHQRMQLTLDRIQKAEGLATDMLRRLAK